MSRVGKCLRVFLFISCLIHHLTGITGAVSRGQRSVVSLH